MTRNPPPVSREACTAEAGVDRSSLLDHVPSPTQPKAVQDDFDGGGAEGLSDRAPLQLAEPNEEAELPAHPSPPSTDAAPLSPPLGMDALSKLLFLAYCQGLQSGGRPMGGEVDIAVLLAKEEAVDLGDEVLVEKLTAWYRTGLSMAQGSPTSQ